MSNTAVRSVGGYKLDTSSAAFGELRATPVGAEVEEVRARMEADGYIYMRNFFKSDDVLAVRRELVRRLEQLGCLEPDADPMDARLRSGISLPIVKDSYRALAVGNEPLNQLLYSGIIMSFWERFLGGPIRHFDYTWIRATPPGEGTSAHTDIVFMGRGTKRLFTSWIPYGDIPVSLGGLAILEGGHRHRTVVEDYGSGDVDTYCENLGEVPTEDHQERVSLLAKDASELRNRLGGRWLTTDFKVGDLLAFGMFTPHVGIDNTSDNLIRLSSDSRYQLAAEAIDPRWIGAEPMAHGKNAKLGMIC
jgi:hypothetical protein